MQTTPALLGALAAGVALALGVSLPLARGDARTPTIPVSEIKPGMKGYGLTVFKGTTPERFDVEVIGVYKSFRPGEPLILVKTPGPRLDVVKSVHGMSGSPIYLEGRLAGAYSYALSNFPVEPIAGVTPIDLMLTEMRRPIPPGFWPIEHAAPLPAGPHLSRPEAHASVERFDGPPGRYDVEAHAQQLASRLGRPDPSSGFVPAATPLMMSGVSERSVAALRKLLDPFGLEPVQGGGGDALDPSAPAHFAGGSGLGVPLSSGDVAVTAIGTATFADGAGKVAGFGHPMLGGGDEALPTCLADVLWINASMQASFKIGECVRHLGTLVQDRQTAIVVDENVAPPTIPVDVDIAGVVGAPRTHWHADVTDDKFLAPSLAAVVLASVVDATASERRDLTWKLTTRVDVAGHGQVGLEDVGIAEGGSPDTSEWYRSKLVTTMGDVLNNPWERARITHVHARFDVRYDREMWRLRGAEVLDPVVDAGHAARVRLHLVPKDGPEATRVVEVTMPEELAGKDVEVEILPGYDVVPDLAPPESLDELLANEPLQTVDPRSIVLRFRVPSQGIAYRGRVTERLPPLTLDALRPVHSDEGPETFQSWSRTVVPVDWYVDGKDKVKIKVRSVVR